MTHMTNDELTDLVRRANAAGHDTIPAYALALEQALEDIADGKYREGWLAAQRAAQALRGNS